MDSVILVTVRSLSVGKKSLIPPSNDATLEDKTLVGTPVSFSRSVNRVEMAEKRCNRSEDPDCCCPAVEELLTVVSCVIFVVARTLIRSYQLIGKPHTARVPLTVGCKTNRSYRSPVQSKPPQIVPILDGTRPALC